MAKSALPGSATAAHLRAEAERVAGLCSQCGACARACPMMAQAPALADGDGRGVVRGVLDLLRGGESSAEALDWVRLCVRSGVCTQACPEEAIDPAYMMRLAKMRAMGAFGEAPKIPVKGDFQTSAKVKAFARLTLTPDEQEQWL